MDITQTLSAESELHSVSQSGRQAGSQSVQLHRKRFLLAVQSGVQTLFGAVAPWEWVV